MSRLGEGSYSQVVLARLKSTSQPFALKILDKRHLLRHNQVQQVRLEREILSRLAGQECIAQLHFTFQDATSLYLGLEYCPGGELFDVIRRSRNKRLDVQAARAYAAEAVLMLQALRREGIVHGDLKPENLLLDARGHLKLVDFGCASEVERLPATSAAAEGGADDATAASSLPQSVTASSVDGQGEDSTINRTTPSLAQRQRPACLLGTADYVAPEVLRNNEVPTVAADLWALGCIIHQMVAGQPPFKAASEYLTFERILAGERAAWVEVAGEQQRDGEQQEQEQQHADGTLLAAAGQLVDALLHQEPEQRLGAQDVEDLKQHLFFEGVDWEGLRQGPAPVVLPKRRQQEHRGELGAGLEWGLGSDQQEEEDEGWQDSDSSSGSLDWELRSLAATLPRWRLEQHEGGTEECSFD